jgi:hypothetical protein
MLLVFRLLVFHEDETEKILKKLNLLEKVKRGEIKCPFCGKPITKENLGAIWKKNGEIYLICEDLECISKAKA